MFGGVNRHAEGTAKFIEQRLLDYDAIQEAIRWIGWIKLDPSGIVLRFAAHKPLHLLRKVFGSPVCDLYGLHAASAALRHADIQTTASYYLGRRVRVTAELGSVLSGADVLPLPAPLKPAGGASCPVAHYGSNSYALPVVPR
jgi:hypothetical protein